MPIPFLEKAVGEAASAMQSAAAAPAVQAGRGDMAVGATATLESGLQVTVNEAEAFTPERYDHPMTRVNVTYANNGSGKQDFNLLDWKAEDAGGAERAVAIWSGDGGLGSGDLKAGGSVTGDVYFDGAGIAKVNYYSNVLFQDDTDISWRLA